MFGPAFQQTVFFCVTLEYGYLLKDEGLAKIIIQCCVIEKTNFLTSEFSTFRSSLNKQFRPSTEKSLIEFDLL